MLVNIGIGSTNVVRLDGLRNALTGAYVNNATVSFVLKELDGAVVQASTAMTYVASSNGRYEGYVPNTVAVLLGEGVQYLIEISVTAAGSTGLFRRVLGQGVYAGTSD